MASIDFPNSPAVNDTFTAGNSSYRWTGLAWVSNNLAAITWTDISGKPTTFPPSAHTHAIADTTGLQTALDGKAATSHTHVKADVTDFAHTHLLADITDYTAPDLSGKQDVVAGVSSTEIGYLDGVTSAIQTQLNGKAAALQPIQELTANYTLASGSNGKLFYSASASTITVTVNFANIEVGERIDFLQTAAGKITISPFMGFQTVSEGNKLSTNGAGTALSLMCYAYDGTYKKLTVIGNLS
jgi:Phage tail repeat like